MPGLSPQETRADFPVHITGTQKARPTNRGPGGTGINSARRYTGKGKITGLKTGHYRVAGKSTSGGK